MSKQASSNAALMLLFIGSGCAALIYEIVWLQQLSLVLGAAAVSIAILLTSFMGGMCLGSLALPKFVSPRWHPLVVYAVLELLIAVSGVAILGLLPIVGRMYWSLGTPGASDLPMRAVVALALLLPPTVCMGATLPAVSRWVEANRTGLARMGWFYGANTLGAVVGTLLTGLYLLRVHDVVVATCVAAGINVTVALVALLIARRVPHTVSADPQTTELPVDQSPAWPVYLAIGLSGLTALGAEVVWTRQLGLLFGPTTYTFSIILSIFLFGLSIGGGAGAVCARRARSPGRALAVTQLLLMAAIPLSAYLIVGVLPYWRADRYPPQPLWERTLGDLLRGLVALLPATCLWGASFSLAVTAATRGRQDPARVVGRVYAANTLGAILGALLISLVVLPRWGGQGAQQALTFIAGIAGLTMLGSAFFESAASRHETALGSDRPTKRVWATAGLLAAAAICPFAPRLVPAVPNALLALGRSIDRWDLITEFLYVADGLTSPVVIADVNDGYRYFHVAGRIEATTWPSDMRTQRLLGHLPALVHPEPKTVLVVGCGSGMTVGACLLHPTVERVVLCEIEPRVLEGSRRFFAAQNHGALDDRRTQIVVDDARHFLATTREKFDIITTDPIHPWVRGAATLYTAEFYELCKAHLNPGGVVAQWVPLYESNEAAVKCELATIVGAFPAATIFSGENNSTGYDVIVLGTVDGSLLINVSTLLERVASNSPLYASLSEVGLSNIDLLLTTLAADGPALVDWLRGAEINRDRNLRLQYLSGLTPDVQTAQAIFESMTRNVPKPRFEDPVHKALFGE